MTRTGGALDTTRQELLYSVIDTARIAGCAILRSGDTPVEGSRPDSPVTEADHAAHRIIVEALVAIDPSIPIISEHSKVPPYTARRDWERFWLVDPLDGTKEFIAGIPEFTTNVALIEHGVPTLGVVFAPALGTMYFAAPGLGAWRQEGQSPATRLRSLRARRDQPLRVVESRSHRSPRVEALLAELQVAERISIGSSLKFCRLAENRADIYPRLTPIMEWDVAAGDCVFRYSAAGADRYSPIRYNTRDLRIPAFVLGFDPDGEVSH
jgi:3'(2'), 5'-bisphosphate nucleotidase